MTVSFIFIHIKNFINNYQNIINLFDFIFFKKNTVPANEPKYN